MMTPSKQSGFTTLRRSESGFTLIELLVVLAIVGMLAALAMTALGSTRAKSRDTKRKGDLLNLQKGLELYFTSNNAYPSTSGVWRAVANKDCPDNTITTTGATGYIPNFAPTYVGVLPTDPRPSSGTCSGYNYRSDGTNFIFGQRHVGSRSCVEDQRKAKSISTKLSSHIQWVNNVTKRLTHFSILGIAD